MEKYVDLALANWDSIALFIFAIGVLLKARRDGKSWKNALIIAVNTLKDEDKMEGGGTIISQDAIDKARNVANEMDAGLAAIKKVEEIINNANTQKGIKLGSLKGKPIYLEDAVGIWSLLRGFIKK